MSKWQRRYRKMAPKGIQWFVLTILHHIHWVYLHTYKQFMYICTFMCNTHTHTHCLCALVVQMHFPYYWYEILLDNTRAVAICRLM